MDSNTEVKLPDAKSSHNPTDLNLNYPHFHISNHIYRNFKKINGDDSHLRDAVGGSDVYPELRLKIKMNELLTLSDTF